MIEQRWFLVVSVYRTSPTAEATHVHRVRACHEATWTTSRTPVRETRRRAIQAADKIPRAKAEVRRIIEISRPPRIRGRTASRDRSRTYAMAWLSVVGYAAIVQQRGVPKRLHEVRVMISWWQWRWSSYLTVKISAVDLYQQIEIARSWNGCCCYCCCCNLERSV